MMKYMNEEYDWLNADNLYFTTITFNFSDPNVGKQIKNLIDLYDQFDRDDQIGKWWMQIDPKINISAADENYIPTINTDGIKVENNQLVWDLTISGLNYGWDMNNWVIDYDKLGLMIAKHVDMNQINWVGQTYYDENVNHISCGYNLFQNGKLVASGDYEKQLNPINEKIDNIDYLSSDYEQLRLQLMTQATNDLNQAIKAKIKQRVFQKPQS